MYRFAMISTDSQASLQVYPFALNRLLHEAPDVVNGCQWLNMQNLGVGGWWDIGVGWLVDDPSGSSRSNPSNSHVLNSTLLGAQRICTDFWMSFWGIGRR